MVCQIPLNLSPVLLLLHQVLYKILYVALSIELREKVYKFYILEVNVEDLKQVFSQTAEFLTIHDLIIKAIF